MICVCYSWLLNYNNNYKSISLNSFQVPCKPTKHLEFVLKNTGVGPGKIFKFFSYKSVGTLF